MQGSILPVIAENRIGYPEYPAGFEGRGSLSASKGTQKQNKAKTVLITAKNKEGYDEFRDEVAEYVEPHARPQTSQLILVDELAHSNGKGCFFVLLKKSLTLKGLNDMLKNNDYVQK